MKKLVTKVYNRLLRPYGWTKSQILRINPHRQEKSFPIDFVVTWVDGSDIEWQRNKVAYSDGGVDKELNPNARYRNWDLLKYWFRAVEQYAPWVHKVYFVTCGHRPAWLNIKNDKLVFMPHDHFIPQEYLPTFNSRTIELNIWRIPELSEHFVLFNDDMFLNRPVYPNDFYEEGLPKLCALAIPFHFQGDFQHQKWERTLLNDISVINESFDIRQSIQKYPEKFFSYVYYRRTKYNRRIYEDAYIAGMQYTHFAHVFRKSVFPDIWNTQFRVMDDTCRCKFRSEIQVTIFLPRLWMIFQGKYVPVDIDYYGIHIELTRDNIPRAIEALKSNARMVCLNDGDLTETESMDTLKMIEKELQSAMESKFSQMSSFEVPIIR